MHCFLLYIYLLDKQQLHFLGHLKLKGQKFRSWGDVLGFWDF